MSEPKDEKLTEKEALAQAKADGIEFVDHWKVEGSDERYDTLKEAEKASKGLPITQVRERAS